ncbi:hypothetical protein DFP72DRAFT_913108 [Ephemerocybe angulata]|uniref:F-box domain-containing protein n=1 Tax=Ephemerocybe angulata TaxID=980116 RepID=A0A8H6HNB0_9AGAR|nr:hypothetical protein DFP72DRAFT_913108 [Tulosesus angulatus]
MDRLSQDTLTHIAAFCVDENDISPCYLSPETSFEVPSRYPEDRRHIARAFALVSRVWYRAALSTVWQYVTVQTPANVMSIICTLTTGVCDARRLMGGYVRRLDFRMIEPYEASSVFQLLPLLHNLTCLAMKSRSPSVEGLSQAGFFQSFLPLHCNGLQRLQLAGINDPPTLRDLCTLGQSLSSLRMLQVTRVLTQDEDDSSQEEALFPMLLVLWIGGTAMGTWATHPSGVDLHEYLSHSPAQLPALSRFDSRIITEALDHFLTCYGTQLTTLQFTTSSQVFLGAQDYLELCPNLSAVRIEYIQALRPGHWDTFDHPRLEQVVLSAPESMAPKSGVEEDWRPGGKFQKHLALLCGLVARGECPKLTKVTVNAVGVFQPAQNCNWWWPWMLMFLDQEVAFNVVPGMERTPNVMDTEEVGARRPRFPPEAPPLIQCPRLEY